MTDHVSDTVIKPPTYQYPFASAPDIIRSHQKDSYFQGVLFTQFSDILRRIYGARFLHTYTTEAKTSTDLLYLCLTTLIGNRTLGEEYCDIVQIEDDTLRLPHISRRAGYILSAILLPFGLNKILPTFRSRIRSKLEANLRRLERKGAGQKGRSYKIQTYILKHLNTLTSPSPIQALTITTFYFSGAYYQLSKRIWGLRYIFTRKVAPSQARIGYEVLGVLLLLQVVVQGYMHFHETIWSNSADLTVQDTDTMQSGTAVLDGGVEVSLDPNTHGNNMDLLLDTTPTTVIQPSASEVQRRMHTPVVGGGRHRYELKDDEEMKWMGQGQQRKCTLCLEELKDPSATNCGHVFCWSCIGDWIREKPECPLCRREALIQHVLPLRC